MAESNKKVLVIEDEPEIRRFLRISLSEHGYVVIAAAEGKEGLALAARENPELIILDLGLPDIDGIEILQNLREWSNVPIIIVSAKEQENLKVKALDMGADDYLTKPFGVQELLARMRLAFRKNSGRDSCNNPIVTVGSIQIDMSKRLVFLHNKEVHLTPIEYALLHELAKNIGAIVLQQTLLRNVWGFGSTKKAHYLRIYMSSLRHKLEEDPTRPQYIFTQPGVGYRLRE